MANLIDPQKVKKLIKRIDISGLLDDKKFEERFLTQVLVKILKKPTEAELYEFQSVGGLKITQKVANKACLEELSSGNYNLWLFTGLKECRVIIFDFSTVGWLGLTEILYVIVFIEYLKKMILDKHLNCDIRVEFPPLEISDHLKKLSEKKYLKLLERNYRILKFLYRWKIFECLENRNISYTPKNLTKLEENLYSETKREYSENLIEAMDVTTNINNSNLIYRVNALKLILSRRMGLSQKATQEISANIMYELIKNIHDHSDCYAAYIALNIRKSSDELQLFSADIEQNSPNKFNDITYFPVNHRHFIELAIVDNGNGIIETLGSILNKYESEIDVLEFSFKIGTTCKSKSLGSDKQYFQYYSGIEGNPKLIPLANVGRGLYHVYNAIKKLSGNIVIRSGHSRLAFISQPEGFIKSLQTSSNYNFFPGTQIKICIPIPT